MSLIDWWPAVVIEYVRMVSLVPTKRWKPDLKQAALRAYFDGSGKSGDKRVRYLALSGLIASPGAWDDFEELWVRATAGSPPWHTKDAFTQQGDFATWTRPEVWALRASILNDCFNKSKHLDMVHANCIVDLPDFRRFASERAIVASTQSPKRLCATWVVNAALDELEDDPSSPSGKRGLLALYFDQGEEFLDFIKKEWNARHNDSADRLSRIPISPATANSRYVIALQAADYLCWHAWRAQMRRRDAKYDDHVANFTSRFATARYVAQIWNYDRLVEAFDSEDAARS